jgi:hypothetical protein
MAQTMVTRTAGGGNDLYYVLSALEDGPDLVGFSSLEGAEGFAAEVAGEGYPARFCAG